jgi:hypothetical protein
MNWNVTSAYKLAAGRRNAVRTFFHLHTPSFTNAATRIRQDVAASTRAVSTSVGPTPRPGAIENEEPRTSDLGRLSTSPPSVPHAEGHRHDERSTIWRASARLAPLGCTWRRARDPLAPQPPPKSLRRRPAPLLGVKGLESRHVYPQDLRERWASEPPAWSPIRARVPSTSLRH